LRIARPSKAYTCAVFSVEATVLIETVLIEDGDIREMAAAEPKPSGVIVKGRRHRLSHHEIVRLGTIYL